VRFTFGTFVLSPGHRALLKDGRPVRLIPKYFDLLVLLVAERQRAVTRQEIFDRVWTDVVVSDGALSQAIRTIRRALSDGPQASQFIRTVSRHGYQFVGDVVEAPDDGPLATTSPVDPGVRPADAPTTDVAREQLVAVLLGEPGSAPVTEEERYDAALALHELGTDAALQRLGDRPGHAAARAILRDARWDVPGAGDVPLFSAHGRAAAIVDLVRLRLRHAGGAATARWLSSIACSAASGVAAGLAGGIALGLARGSAPDAGATIALAIVGGLTGAAGGAGVGGGLAAAEALSRSARSLALVVAAALGGWCAGSLAHHAARAVLLNVFGRNVWGMSGAPEGLVLGAVLGLGYATATRRLVAGGMASPRGAARVRVVLVTATATAVAGVVLALAGRRLVATSLDLVAGAFSGSAVGLAPLARFLGEDSLRPITQTIVSGFEGFMLGAGVSFGLTRRPTRLRGFAATAGRPDADQPDLTT
jgi:DNA-binding winged helix-turn-helix (wHTH) protein